MNSSPTGMTTLHVSGSPSAHRQDFRAVHRLWYIICSCDRILLLVAYGHKPMYGPEPPTTDRKAARNM